VFKTERQLNSVTRLYFFFNFTSQTMPWYSKWSPRRSFRLKTSFI